MRIKIIKLKFFFRKRKVPIISGFIVLLIFVVIFFAIIKERERTVAIVNGYRITIDDIIEKITSSPEFYREYAYIDPRIKY